VSGPLNCAEYEQLAETLVEPGPWAFLSGGAGDETTLRANEAAFGRWTFRPRVLVDVDAVTTQTTVLGTPIATPVLVAPVAYQRLFHPDGELGVARAAAAQGTVMCTSTMSTFSHAELAEGAPGLLQWVQLYAMTNEESTRAHLEDAVAAGCSAVVLTVDTPVLGRRERDFRAGFEIPADLPLPYASTLLANAAHSPATHRGLFSASITWQDIEWIAELTKLPVLLKGILTGDDTALAVEHGAAGIIVSNHGGRQLDGVAASLDALPEVVEAVDGRIEVLVDGGVRRGTDVLKALSLGAKGVLIGRPFLYALAVGGADAVSRMLAMLREEIEVSMTLLGVRRLSELSNDLVTRV
jgi:4-hydroxymandelate oxidase